MRRAFGSALLDIAEQDRDVLLIVGDIGYGIFDAFRAACPDRFFNFGVCEQSMVGAAAGMALEGMKPYVFTITPFLIERAFEQIKLDVDEQQANVTLVGYADYPDQGSTHAELDARALMGLLKNVRSFFPRSAEETRDAVLASHRSLGPTFISLKKAP
jgi:transketolase